MFLHVALVAVFFAAHRTLVLQNTGMPGHVSAKYTSCHETLVADLAMVAIVLFVDIFMNFDALQLFVCFAADRAFVCSVWFSEEGLKEKKACCS